MRNKKNILTEVLGSWISSKDETLYHCPFCKHHKKKLSVNIGKVSSNAGFATQKAAYLTLSNALVL